MNEYFPFDLTVTTWANTHFEGPFGAFLSFIYGGLQPVWSLGIVLLIAAILGIRARSWRRSLAFALTVGLTWVPIVWFKDLIQRPRPPLQEMENPPPFDPADFSFPSGHTGFAIAVVVATIYFTNNLWARTLAVALGILVPVTVLVVGVHFPSDVAAAVVWSVLFGALVAWGVGRLVYKPIFRR